MAHAGCRDSAGHRGWRPQLPSDSVCVASPVISASVSIQDARAVL